MHLLAEKRSLCISIFDGFDCVLLCCALYRERYRTVRNAKRGATTNAPNDAVCHRARDGRVILSGTHNVTTSCDPKWIRLHLHK